MRRSITTFLKTISFLGLAFFATLLLWANWEEPEMHHFIRPAKTAIWQLAPVDSLTAQALEAQLATEPGVAACSISRRTGCVAFVYHPEEVTPAVLYQAVTRYGARIINNSPAPTAPPALRQCPVPPGYLAAIDQVRFMLNLRRFFVTV